MSTTPPPPTNPTDSEIAILAVLWDQGPSTVRQVHDALSESGRGYTTALKLMQIMAEKGLVLRDESQRTHVYRPAQPRRQTQRKLLRGLTAKAFGGSARALVLEALAGQRYNKRQIEEVQRLLDELERNRR